jgi:hypothetical protein
MSIFQQLGQQGQQPRQDPRQAVNEIKADPSGFLSRAGFSVPAGMTDSGQIIQHLISSGQVSNPRLRQVMGMVRR